MQQHLVVPTAHGLLAEMILQRIRREAARVGKYTCPDCRRATISANAATCFACSNFDPDAAPAHPTEF
jgi:ribosomal protein L37AE/L43A